MKKLILFFILICSSLTYAQPLVPYTKDKLWGFCDLQKNVVIPPNYKRVDLFRSGLARVMSNENGKYGIINAKGDVIVPFDYGENKLGQYIQDRIYFVKDNKYGYFDGTGKVVITPQYEFAYNFFGTKPLTVAKLNGKYGIINQKGEIVEPFQHPAMTAISESGYVSIFTDKGNGVMNLKGEIIVPPKYREKKMHKKKPAPQLKQNFATLRRKDGAKDHAVVFNNGGQLLYYIAKKSLKIDHFYNQNYLLVTVPNLKSFGGGKRGLVDIDGNIVLEWDNYPYVGEYNDNAVVVGKKKGSDIIYGLIDLKGTTILKPKYSKITAFDKNGIARFEYKGKSGFINDKGKVVQSEKVYDGITSFGFSNDGLIYFKDNKKGGIATYAGEILFRNTDKYQHFFSDHGLIRRRDNTTKKQVLIDRSTKVLTKEYSNIMAGSYGFQVKSDKKEGVLDKSGNVILKTEYDNIDFSSAGFFVVEKDNLAGLYSKDGTEVLPITYKNIRIVDEGLKFWVKSKENKWSMVDLKGKPLSDHSYSKIEYYRDGYYNVSNNYKWGLVNSEGKEVVATVCKKPLTYVKSPHLLGVIKTGSVIHGYIGKNYTLFWD